MYTVEIKHENGNGQEFGYGVYVNAYLTWQDVCNDTPKLYASECVPFGQEGINEAEARVLHQADVRAKQEYMGGT